jgi:hypothetical protein
MKKIVVLGQNRSGTKYLTNLIASAFDLACVQCAEHGGLIESNIHSYYARKYPGVLTSKEKDEILDSFIREFTFTKSKLNLSELYKINWNSCLEFFTKFYTSNAVKLNKKAWVQKASSLYLDNFMDENIIMIITQRNSLDVLNSSIKAFKLNFFRATRKLFSIHLMHKYEKHFANTNFILLLKYENLLAVPKSCIIQISELIKINPIDYSGIVAYNNSSFKHQKKTKIKPIFKLFDIIFKIIIYFIPIDQIKKRVKRNLEREINKLVANSIDLKHIEKIKA